MNKNQPLHLTIFYSNWSSKFSHGSRRDPIFTELTDQSSFFSINDFCLTPPLLALSRNHFKDPKNGLYKHRLTSFYSRRFFPLVSEAQLSSFSIITDLTGCPKLALWWMINLLITLFFKKDQITGTELMSSALPTLGMAMIIGYLNFIPKLLKPFSGKNCLSVSLTVQRINDYMKTKL